jgi:ABC-type glycerol-3-phosphate transport system substrate-binding protein
VITISQEEKEKMSNKKLLSVVSVLVILAFLAACAPAAPTGAVVTNPDAASATSPVEIWIDAAREESAAKFIDKYPEKGKLVTTTTTDYGQLPQKILFWNNVGGGWPDASFAGPNIVPLINDASHDYLGDIKPFVTKEVIDGFAAGSLENCWDGEKLYCLRNDLAFFVTWYNAPKVKELGLTVPKTWEEMQATCLKVKASNPEITCVMAQPYTSFMNILASNKCPVQQIMGAGKIRLNATHENCVKAAKFWDEMVASGTMRVADMFGKDTSDIVQADNWLFIPLSSWFGDYVIRGTYYQADDPAFQGKIGVAPAPMWEGQDHPWVFWWGGAAWVLSRHSKNPQLAVDFLNFMTTDEIKNQGTYPAYVPAAEEWLKNRMPTLTYLEDTTKAGEILKQESTHMWTKFAESPVDIFTTWGPIQTRIDAGELTYEAALAEFQKVNLDQAGKLGYEATTDGMDDFK